MRVNTWGIGRRTELVREFDAEKYPFIERVREHLSLSFIEIKGNGEPVQIALGSAGDTLDPEAVQARVTPFFSSFDALDFFCRLNLQHYLGFDPSHGLPRRWFWEESGARGSMAVPSGSMRIVDVPTSVRASDGTRLN